LIGPLAPLPADDRAKRGHGCRCWRCSPARALGVVDARARGLVVQTAMPV
jgi:hypothetical protein